MIVNSPAIRTITIKNVQPTDLLLSFAAADPDDLAIYAKATELPPKAGPSSEAGSSEPVPESEQPPKAAPVSKRERFLESMAIRGDPEPRSAIVARTARQRDKSAVRGTAAGDGETHPKPINMVSALKKGSKGRSVAVSRDQARSSISGVVSCPNLAYSVVSSLSAAVRERGHPQGPDAAV